MALSFLMIRRPPRSALFPYTTLFPTIHKQLLPSIEVPLLLVLFVDLVERENFFVFSLKLYCQGVPRKIQLVNKWKDRKSTRLNSSHANISNAVLCLTKKKSMISTRAK